MPFTFTVPNEYGYVILTATATTYLAQWHAGWTSYYRRAAGVKHPIPYASASEASTNQAAYLFNCAQRAHANYLENQPSLLATLMVAGLKYPLLASAMGAAWGVARLVYAFGYVSPTQKFGSGRYPGLALFVFPQIALGIMSGFVGWNMLMA
ncbi:MAG: hypothetical protein M1830_004799 [Pleopsidium flavum]|nr:MAG: hypothetical protein M1830_004799 [Pleopsidium flavum]